MKKRYVILLALVLLLPGLIALSGCSSEPEDTPTPTPMPSATPAPVSTPTVTPVGTPVTPTTSTPAPAATTPPLTTPIATPAPTTTSVTTPEATPAATLTPTPQPSGPGGGGSPPTPPPHTQVYITPASQAVDTGQRFTVDILIEPADTVAGWQFNTYFDPTLVSVDSVENGGFLPGFFSPGTIDNDAGIIYATYAIQTGPGGNSAPGSLARITLDAGDTAGGCTIHLDNVKVGDADNNPLPVDVTDGYVQIEAPNP